MLRSKLFLINLIPQVIVKLPTLYLISLFEKIASYGSKDGELFYLDRIQQRPLA